MTISLANANTNSTASGTGLTVVLSSPEQIGDLFLALCAVKNTATIATPTGFTKITQTNGTSFCTAYFWAINTGSITNPAFTWTGSAAAFATVYHLAGNTQPTVIGASNFASGTTNPHTTSSITSTGFQSMAVAIDCQESSTVQGTNPTGWTGEIFHSDATSVISTSIWFLQLGAVGSTTGAISVTEGAVGWTQAQIEILADQLYPQICL